MQSLYDEEKIKIHEKKRANMSKKEVGNITRCRGLKKVLAGATTVLCILMTGDIYIRKRKGNSIG